MAKKVEVIVGLIDKTGKGSKSAISNIGGIAKSGALLGVGAVAGVAALGAGVFKLASDAEPLVGVGKAFEGITADFEGGSAAMLSALKKGGAGMITNTDLMTTFNKATQLVSVDFGKKLPDAMGMVGKVAAATGQDMGFLLDSLTTGIGRMSPMILDNLGIQVSLSEANEAYAESIGKSTSELTKAEQQTALMAQVMQKLTENTANMPDISAPFSQLKTIMKNLYEQGIMKIFKILEPLAAKFVHFAENVLPRITEAFDRFFGGMGTGTPFLDNLMTLFNDLGIALGVPSDKLRKITDDIQGFIDKIMDVLDPIVAFIDENIELKDVLIALGIFVSTILLPIIGSLLLAIGSFLLPLGFIIAAVVLLRQAWERDFAGIRDFVAAVWESIKTVFDAFKLLFAGDWGGFLDKIKQAWATAWTAIVEFVGNIWRTIKPKLIALWGSLSAWFASVDWKQVAINLMVSISNALKAFWAWVKPHLAALWTSFYDWFSGVNWGQVAIDLITAISTKLATFWDWVKPILEAWWITLTTWFHNLDWKQIAINRMTAFANKLDDFWSWVKPKLDALWTLVKTWFGEKIPGWYQLALDGMGTFVNALVAFPDLVKPKLEAWWTSVKTWFNEKLQEWGELARNGLMIFGKAIDDFWDWTKPKLERWWTLVKGWFGWHIPKWKELGINIINAIIDGLVFSATALIESITGIVQGAIDAVKETIREGSPSKVFMDIGYNMGAGLALGMEGTSPMVSGAAAGMATAAIGGASSISTTNNYYLTAKYGDQSPGSLAQDVRLMEMLAAV